MSSEILAQLAGALASGKIRVVDLSQTLKASTPVIQLPPEFAPSSPFRIEEISHYDQRGPGWYWNNFACGEHTGTHFDAPAHWVTGKDYADGFTDTLPVQRFVAPVATRARRAIRSSCHRAGQPGSCRTGGPSSVRWKRRNARSPL
jgi:Putative cyclase